jgi:hypothetical protein
VPLFLGRNLFVFVACHAESQTSISFVERNGTFDIAAQIENSNLAGTEAGATLGAPFCLQSVSGLCAESAVRISAVINEPSKLGFASGELDGHLKRGLLEFYLEERARGLFFLIHTGTVSSSLVSMESISKLIGSTRKLIESW